MHIKEILIVSLLCLGAVSCESQQEIIADTPTSKHANISVIGDRGVNFNKWHLSFVLPPKWDVNEFEFEYGGGFDEELYRFVGPEIVSDHRKTNPDITFSFHTFRDDSERIAFLNKPFLAAEEIRLKIEKTFSPMEIGLKQDFAIVHRCSCIVGINYSCYVIRSIYESTGAEIWMNADSYIFSQVESQFLDVIKNISFQ